MMHRLSLYPLLMLVCVCYGDYRCDTTVSGTSTIVNCSSYVDGGILIMFNSYLDGALHGEQKEWYRNGTLHAVSRYEHGQLVDTSFRYFENGRVKSRVVKTGINLTFSEKGDTLTITKVKNGKPVDVAKSFYPGGSLKGITRLNDSGQKHGLSEKWREDGTRKDSIVYKNGDIIEVRRYFKNGKLHYHKYQKPVNRDINAVYYDPKGKKVGEVKNGKGTYISYSEDGKSARRVYMENDEVIKIEEIETE